MKQFFKWGETALDAPGGDPRVFFLWPGGRGWIEVYGFTHGSGESIAAFAETPGFMPSVQIPGIDIQGDGAFPFEAPAGLVELRIVVGGGTIGWNYLIVTTMD